MKKILFILSLLALTANLSAQITHTAGGAVDENAQKILSQAQKTLNSSAHTFTVTMVNKDANKKESARMSAKVIYFNGKYKVTFGQQVMISDGASVWQINKQGKEVIVDKASTSTDDLLNPGLLLANYNKNFKAKFIRKDEDGTAIIDMTPLKNKSYHKVRLFVNSANGVIKKMEMHNYDGSCGTYTISNFAATKTDASTFTYSASNYPGFEVIDMR